jgi:hypothetical protein
MRDRTAMTEPLTIGQQLVARWESVNSGWSEPADLAEAIDAAIAAEREACAAVASFYKGRPYDKLKYGATAGTEIASAIRARQL